MRLTPLASLLLSAALLAQPAPQRGVFTEDIDRTVDACTNFFDYANGAWRKANPIPASMQRWSRRWASGELSKEQLRTILDDLSQRKEWPTGSVDQQITDFYGSCMDEQRINELGIKPIQPLLGEIDKIRTRAQLQQMIARLNDLSVSAPFIVGPSYDNHNPTQVIAFVVAGGLGLPDRDYYISTEKRFVETRAKYLEHVAAMFELAGQSKDAAQKSARDVFALESRLAVAHLTNVERRNPKLTDNMMSIAQLQEATPHFDWTSYFRRTGIQRADVNVMQPKFMAAADRELAEAPVSTWREYLKWRLLQNAAEHLSQPFVEENFRFYQAHLRGSKEMKPRWKRCVENTDSLLGEALGQRYVERYFPAEAKARMQEMVKNLLAAMDDTIRGLEWMGPETKQQALAKLATFNPKVGYPDRWKDYSRVAIKPGAYFQNLLAATKFGTTDDRARIGKPTDRGRWEMTPPTSNAYYNPPLNEIVFPAGILQPPAFDVNATDAVNYGAIGVVIGHEISHGFDDQGSQYDAQGRLRNWWTDDDRKRFLERAECVVNQFEGYFIEPGIHHNGKLVLGESIGDLAGAKIAYLGLQKAQAKNPGRAIDGFSPDQQFFIAWGQFRGDEIRPETQRIMVQGGPHPTGEYRVIGPVSNMPEFASAFGCKQDALMVRPVEKRCEVW
ncbi:MAG TPA: M13 family metallopeptidase [Thermoanaerobaculia bacterium]|nr:M13 family metallopeptidase [Thermoanaerobaculia bacterium]